MAEPTHLYLLVFPHRRMLKVGKADDVLERSKVLSRSWGAIDHDASYQLRASRTTIFGLERSLHFLLDKYALNFDVGPGKSELFALEALELALRYVSLFAASCDDAVQCVRGVPKKATPVRACSQPAMERAARVAFEHEESVVRIRRQLYLLDRLLRVLKCHQARIAYQYDIVENRVVFRFRGRQPPSDKKLMDLLMLDYRDERGRSFGTSYTGASIDDVFQLTIRLPSTTHPRIAELAARTEEELKTLPKRSVAAYEDIPIIDESAMCADLFRQMNAAAIFSD